MSAMVVESIADLTVTENNNSKAKTDQEAYKYWIHCNYCYYKYYTKTLMLYLLSCHHVLCEKCIIKESTQNEGPLNKMDLRYKCRICSNIARIRLIGNDMPRHLKELFHPKLWLNDLPTARIFKFQSKHREHIRKAMSKAENSRKRLNTQILAAIDIEKKFEDELRRLKHENMKLERRVRPVLKAHREKKIERIKRRNAEINLNSPKFSNLSQCARTVGIQPIRRFTATDRTPVTSILNLTSTSEKRANSNIKSMDQETAQSLISFTSSAPKSSFDL